MLDRVLNFGDGWLPQPPREKDLTRRMAELRRRAEGEGRPRPIIMPFHSKSEPEFVEEMQQAGADGCVFWIRPEGRDEVEASLDRIVERLGEFVGAAA